jgi:O-glycosyl hydrolase
MKGVYISAYKNRDTGEFTIVAVNDRDSAAALNILPDGFASGHLTPYITNDSLNMKQGHDLVSVDGKFQTALPPKSVVTFVGEKA